ncbi:hypothetical protein JW859_14020 [bacterium]|nr:hypothetical protein [bacterium]
MDGNIGQTGEQRRFTPAELAEYDGKDGRSAYVAYKGKVYDVTQSKLWRNGLHVRAHHAGEDLTDNMLAAPHDDDVMERFKAVGIVIDDREQGSELAEPPWWAQLSLDHHLHPIAVHFPTALGAVVPLFAILSLFFTGNQRVYETLQWVAFSNLVVCGLFSIPAVITGVISWYFNYAAVMTPIYRIKWGGSIVLLVLTTLTLLVRFLWMDGLEPQGPAFWVYTVLLVLHAPVVATLGHYGGKITFPS